MCRLDKLHRMRSKIYRIARKHNARRVYVFGSCARKEETPESDIDFVVEFNDGATLFDHAGMEYDLSQCLHKKVDVIVSNILRDDAFSRSVREDMVAL
ncbi:MAG: Nucleotidyltransferase domain protein [Lentisphaerae bacterium ADurb.Bin242]|nr:MAG: Nucleotidyltransferase domain protein [Lentisphaerae bacterium ADurb.Bin242]